MKISKKHQLCVIFAFAFTSLFAQEGTTTSGGDGFGSGGSVSYSIGQVFYSSSGGSSGSVTEGIQQSYQISVSTQVQEAQGISLSTSAFPNPTVENLNLQISNIDLKSVTYRLYDLNGKILQTDKITQNETSIIMAHLVPATYFLKVYNKDQEIKTFKIIKN